MSEQDDKARNAAREYARRNNLTGYLEKNSTKILIKFASFLAGVAWARANPTTGETK